MIVESLVLPTPADYGLPTKFTEWRPNQFPSIEWALSRPERFLCLCAPTGFGKSLVILSLAQLSGLRTIVLTSTKGLQDQLRADFHTLSTDLRGQQNYQCPIAGQFGMPTYTNVSDAPCQMGFKCKHRREGGCPYYDNYRVAQHSDVVVTNYQCWMYDQLKEEGLWSERPVDVLVLDEAHDAESQLAKFMSVELERKDCLQAGIEWPRSGGDQAYWQAWASESGRELGKRIKSYTDAGHFEEAARCRKLKRKLDKLTGMATTTTDPSDIWIIEELQKSGGSMLTVRFAPLWPKRYAEAALFRSVPKVILVSATANRETARSLGISVEPAGVGRSPQDFTLREYPSSFPISSRPIIHVPTVQMNWRNEQDDAVMLHMIRQIDRILEQRQDRKGIIHTVSYKRARLILDNSKFASRMLIHGSDNRSSVIEKFRTAPEHWGCVLLSPAVDTGYDFPGDQARFQIIVKVPFPSTQDAVMAARCKQDKEYSNHITAQTLQQMTGRPVRAEDDWAETFILDNNIQWFVGRNRKMFSRWWLEAYRVVKGQLPGPIR